MSQLLVALWLVAGIWYLASTNPKNDQNGIPLQKEGAPAPTMVEPNKTDPTSSDQLKLQPINPAADQSSHAILPDRSAAVVARSDSPSQTAHVPQPGIVLTPGDWLQANSEAIIRRGPSASAQVIGAAHAGAELHVQSRDAEWVQFVDPATKHAGWISLADLSPVADSFDVPVTVPKATLTKPSRPGKLLGSAKPRNAERKRQTTAQHKPIRPPRGYAELPRDQEFEPPRQFFRLVFETTLER